MTAIKKCLFLILIFFSQCNYNIDNQFWFVEEKPENRERIFKIFNNYIEHFPSKDEYADIKYSWILNPDTEFNLTLYVKGLSKSMINKYLKKHENQIIATYPANKECLLVLNRFANRENYGIYEEDLIYNIANRNCYKSKYPIPNFWQSDYYAERTECHLPEDFTIYVFDAKPGEFIEEEKLSNKNYLPNEWGNGFSIGVAVSYEKEAIIFWTIIW